MIFIELIKFHANDWIFWNLNECWLNLEKLGTYIDIASATTDYWSYAIGSNNTDFSEFKSLRSGRGPLLDGWQVGIFPTNYWTLTKIWLVFRCSAYLVIIISSLSPPPPASKPFRNHLLMSTIVYWFRYVVNRTSRSFH